METVHPKKLHLDTTATEQLIKLAKRFGTTRSDVARRAIRDMYTKEAKKGNV